jgi:hypothetical protein
MEADSESASFIDEGEALECRQEWRQNRSATTISRSGANRSGANRSASTSHDGSSNGRIIWSKEARWNEGKKAGAVWSQD